MADDPPLRMCDTDGGFLSWLQEEVNRLAYSIGTAKSDEDMAEVSTSAAPSLHPPTKRCQHAADCSCREQCLVSPDMLVLKGPE